MIDQTTLLNLEQTLQLKPFTHDKAWELAACIKQAVVDESLKPVGIRITYKGLLILHFLTDGRKESPWLLRKERTVLESGHSSLYVMLEAQKGGYPSWVDSLDYAICGGGFPILENGECVGAICVSGLEHTEDHRLILDALHKVQSL